MLKLTPDQLFSLSPIEFIDMYDAYQYAKARDLDSQREVTAWLISYIVSVQTGKKTLADKIYKSIFDENGDLIETEDTNHNVKVIGEDERKRREAELLAQFNTK